MIPDPSTQTSSDTVILPLQKVRGIYRACDDGYAPDNSPRAQARWLATLGAVSDEAVEIVEIAGRLYRTRLLVRRTNPKLAYARLDQRYLPADIPVDPPIPAAYDAYADYLRDECRFSEPLTDDTRISLTNTFIQPRFRLLDPGEEKTISWRRLRDHARIVMTGGPGAGKTSSLRRLALDLLTPDAHPPFGSQAQPDTMPILIQLRDFPVEDFGPAIIRRFINAERAAELESEFAPPLEGRRLLLLIDGLDELTTNGMRRDFLARLTSLCRENPLLRVVLTSREPLSGGVLDDFTHVRLLPFGTPEIHQWTLFYSRSHQLEPSRWTEFIDLIRYDLQLRELVGNPLLLALTASLHWRYPNELNNRVGLLGECVDALVKNWDASRGIARWRDADITPRQIKRLLNTLSSRLVKEGRDEFTLEDVSTAVDEMTGFRKDSDTLLAACRTSGLVRRSGQQHYVFVHQSFADYFAASDMVSQTFEVTERIRHFSSQDDGRLFWRLTCGMASNADSLLNAVRKHGEENKNQGDERDAAFMLAQALGEEISASPGAIVPCARLVVSALESRLSAAETVHKTIARANWSHRADRKIVWAGGVAAAPGQDSAAEFKVSARLLELIHRATSGTASAPLTDFMAKSEVPLVRQAAAALREHGWYESQVSSEGDRTVLYLVITQPTDTGIEP